MTLVAETNLPNLFYRGKVRDTYALDGHLLMVATDRVSAFDVVLPTPIPDKGKVLTLLSAFWFEKTAHIIPNHLVTVVDDVAELGRVYGGGRDSTLASAAFPDYLRHRAMVVRKAQRLAVECVARGYIAGSAWAEYRETGTVGGATMPPGLRESDALPEPMFTPTTKADVGHDLPITLAEMASSFGAALTAQMAETTLAVYRFAAAYARERGIVIADTKVEYGLINGRLCLIDELLTPDSSRLWDAAEYSPGKSQPSFDKQYLRDWLTASGWNREPPAPALPPDVVEMTAAKYREAYRRLVGLELPQG